MSKNILLLSNAYFPSIGGIENSLRHLAQEARIAGDKIEIIVSDIGLNEQQSGNCRRSVSYPLSFATHKGQVSGYI
jgi:hypothetical protein